MAFYSGGTTAFQPAAGIVAKATLDVSKSGIVPNPNAM